MGRPCVVLAILAVFLFGWVAVAFGEGPSPEGGSVVPSRATAEAADHGVEIRLYDGLVVIATDDADVELTVGAGGRSVKIVDRKTGEAIELDPRQLEVVLGGGANRLRFASDKLVLTRGGEGIVEIHRKAAGRPSAARPVAREPAEGEVRCFAGHHGRVVSVAFSPDGRRIVSGGWDGTVRLWDVETGRELHRSEGHRQVNSVAFAPDGRHVLFGAGDRKAHLWHAETGSEVRQFDHGEWVHAVAFSPRGDRILTGGAGGTVRLWDVDSGRSLRSFEQPMNTVCHVAFSSDGTRALCTGGNYVGPDVKEAALLRVWDLQTGAEVFRLTAPVRTLLSDGALSPDGRRVLAKVIYGRHRLAVWDVETGEKVQTLPEQGNSSCLEYSPDGRRVLSAGLDGRITLWDIERGAEITTFSAHEGPVADVAFSPDGRYALTAGWDHMIRLWRLPGEGDFARSFARALHRLEHQGPVYDVAFSPDGRRALSCGFDLALRLWDVQTGEKLREFVGNKAWHIVNDLSFSPDGRYAVLGAGQSYKTGRVTLWDVEGWAEVRQLGEHEYPVMCVAFSPDGRFAVSGTLEGYVRYLDVNSGREIRRYEPAAFGRTQMFRVQSLSFSPDGRLVACAETGKTRIWEIDSGREVCVFNSAAGNVNSAIFTPDSNEQVLTAEGSTICLWDVTTAREVRRIAVPHQVMALAFCPDGRRVLAGDHSGTIELWDLDTGRRLQTLEGHGKQVTAVDVSPDGRFALSGSYDQTVRIWELPRAP